MNNEVFETKAKKINPEQVEILGADGTHIAGNDGGNAHQANPFAGGAFGGMKMVKVGPVGALIGIVMLPFIIVGFLLLAIFAMFFGRAVFGTLTKSGIMKVIKR